MSQGHFQGRLEREGERMEASLPGRSRGKGLDQAIRATGIPDKSRAAPVLLAQGPIWTCSPQHRRHLNHQSQEKQGRGLGPLPANLILSPSSHFSRRLMGSSARPGRKSLAASYEGTGNRGPQRRATDDPSQIGCSSLFLFRGGGPLREEESGFTVQLQ